MITSKKTADEGLDSSARISVIETFVPLKEKWGDESNSLKITFEPIKESVWNPLADNDQIPFFKNMPMIIKGDGEPWDLGNLYLINLFYKKAKVGEPNVTTIRSHADSLLNYLRWIESIQKKGSEIHVLYLPKNESKRVSYRYRRYLLGLIKNNIITSNTASKRMSRVISFYRSCIEDKLVGPNDISNLPFEEVRKTILTTNRVGLQSFIQVRSSNLAIQTTKANSRVDEVNDEGEKLRPLSEEEQTLILRELKETSTRLHQLVFLFALFTGARVQTVGTLKINKFMEAFEKQSHLQEIRINVGRGTEIDTKKDRRYVLHIPTLLASEIVSYINSPIAKKYRQKSYYGDADSNYVFLTKGGEPFYTSKAEIEDRKASTEPWSKDSRFKIKDGQALRVKVRDLIVKIRRKKPSFRSFRFHDLRATFANNFLSARMSIPIEKTLSNGKVVDITRRNALSETRKRMGHASESTTELYLQRSENIEKEKQATEIFENRLFEWV